MDWPKFLQIENPQWFLTIRVLTTPEGSVRAVDVVTRSGDVCYFPDAPFTELDGLNIGVNLSQLKATLADRLWEALQNHKLTPDQQDFVVSEFLHGMEGLIRTRDQFFRKYGISNPPAAAFLQAKIKALEKQRKGATKKGKEMIDLRITEILELFLDKQDPGFSSLVAEGQELRQ